MRNWRANKKAPPGKVTSIHKGAPQRIPDGAGPAERAVLEELSALTSAETRKGAAQSAIALARILDNPNAISNHVQAAKALPVVLEDLRKGSARRKGRLASVQAMTKTATGT
jgi:hypothetical protein